MARTQVSAKDVAELAGVSRAAVSRTFTPGASVSAETRAKVHAAADELGYHVNHLARGLITSNTGIVALIASEIGTPYRSKLLAALTEHLQAAGKVSLLINTDRSDESVSQALRKAIAYRTDAAIVLSGMPDSSLAETCLRNGMRLVLINRDEERRGATQIRLDDEAAGRQAFAALMAAGCTRLAMASSLAGTPSLESRARGFMSAAQDAGQDVILEVSGMTSYQTGLDVGTRLMTRENRPDGVFCSTDLIAFGVMDAARRRFKLDVPKDVCVIGFDDVEEASWESYDLTTFRQPLREIAKAAIESLSHPSDDAPRAVSLKSRLIWRGSIRG
ncbi:LacI family transcriptional regulator [Pacificibacter maritimus]|uniref:LacI family transcriptional regulator n=1 Tax=Pacificibacter maritimus TaxID=762213 RepID=A0A3N4UN33_9RHOB|nr:LacI family DNA-binding transcriptional regulator [Pacificibacter maritimus]RPE71853.1 LacI family transcriptional regulator [Pacificibacter maritimus]